MTTFSPESGIVITPISSKPKKTGPCSFSDYKEQLRNTHPALNTRIGESLYWDDSKSNKTKVGDLFVFRFESKCVIIHLVEEVTGPETRLESWSKNVGQGDRNVLKLSNKSVNIPWEKWSTFDYKGGRQGTTYMDTKKWKEVRDKIIEYSNERFNSE
jgi:hypothetical protein